MANIISTAIAKLTGIGENNITGISDINPVSVLNGGINFGIDPDTSESRIPGIIDEKEHNCHDKCSGK